MRGVQQHGEHAVVAAGRDQVQHALTTETRHRLFVNSVAWCAAFEYAARERREIAAAIGLLLILKLQIFFASADRGDSDREPSPAQGFGNLRFTGTGDVVPIRPNQD